MKMLIIMCVLCLCAVAANAAGVEPKEIDGELYYCSNSLKVIQKEVCADQFAQLKEDYTVCSKGRPPFNCFSIVYNENVVSNLNDNCSSYRSEVQEICEEGRSSANCFSMIYKQNL